MTANSSTYRPGRWVVLGTILGAFLGLLFGKFALGLIFGFLVGIMIDSSKRKAMKSASPNDGVDPTKV
jgi:hypothetical protein